jgi:hypothetical protein
LDRSALEDRCCAQSNEAKRYLNDQSPADKAEQSLGKDVKVEEEEGEFRNADSDLDEALEYEKV